MSSPLVKTAYFASLRLSWGMNDLGGCQLTLAVRYMRLFVCTLLLCLLLISAPARAGLTILRDAETEQWLRELATPIFQQAGIDPQSVSIVLVQSPEINAFVAGGMNIFIYTGLLRAAKTPDELLGVIAHETGHIAGGHLVRTQEQLRSASATAILSTLAGLAAAVASGDGAAGAAAVSLGQEVAQRNLLSYSRTQESAADQAALRYLAGANLNAQGLHDFLYRLQDEELLPTSQQSEFVRTHPLTRERFESVQAAMESSPPRPALPPEVGAQYQRLLAKLTGYLDPRGTLQRQGGQVPADFAGRYARVLALHQTGDTQGALTLLAELQRLEPKNPYLHELHGQILYESGQVDAAIAPYRLALSLADGQPLLRIGLAQALLATDDASDLREAGVQLEAALTRERGSPQLWRLLATSYGRQNQIGMAAYALAEEANARGDAKTARLQAKRAQELLPENSPGWLRAADLLASVKEP